MHGQVLLGGVGVGGGVWHIQLQVSVSAGAFQPIVEAKHWDSCVDLLWIGLSFRGITLSQKVKVITCEGP